MLEENLKAVRGRIARACAAAGRPAESVRLLAVTKTIPVPSILEAVSCGITVIGESRVQEAQEKFQAVHRAAPGVAWHMIGRLQRNKVNRAVEIFERIESLDSLRLAQAIERRAAELGKVQECLIEVKVSEEEAKSGLDPARLPELIAACAALKHLKVRGLMAIAPYFEDPDRARPYFRKAKEIFDSHFKGGEDVLSMGMSHDFEAAIEEGSTQVRIGSALFGARQ